jgi:hypothetical protein
LQSSSIPSVDQSADGISTLLVPPSPAAYSTSTTPAIPTDLVNLAQSLSGQVDSSTTWPTVQNNQKEVPLAPLVFSANAPPMLLPSPVPAPQKTIARQLPLFAVLGALLWLLVYGLWSWRRRLWENST